MDRREFVQTSAAVAVASQLPLRLPQADASIKDLCMRALSSAKTAGASYADVRVGRTRLQSVSTREQQITNLSDGETFGFGIRVLAQGAWGFAASRDLSGGEIDRMARLAVAQARQYEELKVSRPRTTNTLGPRYRASSSEPASLSFTAT